MKKTVLLDIIVAIILVISGYYLYTQKQTPKQEIDALKTNTDTPQKQKPEPIAEKRQDIPSGWKEYIDNEYKFSILYPEEFKYENLVDQTKVNEYRMSRDNASVIDFYVNVLTDMPLRLLYIYAYNSDVDIEYYIGHKTINTVREYSDIKKLADDLTFKQVDATHILDYHNQYEKNRDIFADEYIKKHIKKVTYNNIDFYKLEAPGEFKYYLKKNNNVFVFTPDDVTYFEQMVKSFKFIE